MKRFLLVALGVMVLLGGIAAYFAIFHFRPPASLPGPVSFQAVPDDLSWSFYGRDKGLSRFVEINQITPENVRHLQPAWTYSSGDVEAHAKWMGRSASQATPILAAGSLIYCTPFNSVIALDPETGTERWRYDHALPEVYRPANKFVCRGVTPWTDVNLPDEAACKTRIFMGTNDVQVIALDAHSGQRCDDFGTQGIVKIDPGMELLWAGEMQITSAPAVIGDVVIVGSAISDNARAKAPRGSVRAFDARTGAARWSFDPVAGVDNSGHSNVWSSIAVDDELGLVYLPTTSPSPDFYGGLRQSGTDYANAVVAVEGATGAIRWHFQTVHHDVWDFDLPTGPSFLDVEVDGVMRPALAQGTKQGFIFLLDRETGKPLLPVEERPVPPSQMLGEALSPTQPIPVRPPALVPQHASPEKDAWGLTPWDRGACRDMMEAAGESHLYDPPDANGTIMRPFTGGGINWGGVAIDPKRRYVIANVMDAMHLIKLLPASPDKPTELKESDEFAPMTGAPYSLQRTVMLSPLGLPCNKPVWSQIAAVDMQKGEIVWKVRLGTTRHQSGPISLPLGAPNMGGPMVTASGLVFIGASTDGYLRAFDIESGAELWGGDLPAAGIATPMSYAINGKQYVVIAAGGHAWLGGKLGDSIIAFALPGEPKE